jgi:hypothetical protein
LIVDPRNVSADLTLGAMRDLRIIAPESADGADLIALRQWMVESVDLRGVRVIAHRSTPEPGTMPGTGVVEALVTVITDKAVLAATTAAIGGWVTARLSTRRTRLRIKYGDREAEVDTARVHDLDDLAAWLRDQLDQDGPPAES